MPQEPPKVTTSTILCPGAPLTYKYLQHVNIEDYGWIMLKHVLHIWASNIGVKEEDMQKQIYDMWVIFT